jgi:Uma2 family endonuclease
VRSLGARLAFVATVDTLPVEALDAAWPPVRRFTIAEYHRLIDAGIIGEDERVELLEGVIVRMSPQNEPGARVVVLLTRHLNRALGDEYQVRPQLPVTLPSSGSEPEPDLAVVKAADAQSRLDHPQTMLLAIEVSLSSLRFGRKVKARIYARAGIPEYWIVNVEAEHVEVFRDPDPDAGAYRTTVTVERSETLVSVAVSGLSVPVAALFT